MREVDRLFDGFDKKIATLLKMGQFLTVSIVAAIPERLSRPPRGMAELLYRLVEKI
jgi:hypothetical protein